MQQGVMFFVVGLLTSQNGGGRLGWEGSCGTAVTFFKYQRRYFNKTVIAFESQYVSGKVALLKQLLPSRREMMTHCWDRTDLCWTIAVRRTLVNFAQMLLISSLRQLHRITDGRQTEGGRRTKAYTMSSADTVKQS